MEREKATEILIKILEEDGYNNIALREGLYGDEMNVHQRAFVTEVVNGVLRNLFLLDYIIDGTASIKTADMKPFIRNALRAAVYQLRFMDKVQNYAVCSETVNLVKKHGFVALAGFINGVLRGVLRNDKLVLPNDSAERLSVEFSVPAWLAAIWVKKFGEEKTRAMCAVNNVAPPVSVCVNTLKTNKVDFCKEMRAQIVTLEESANVDECLKMTRLGDFSKRKTFLDGHFHVMDESAMIAVNSLDPQKGDRLLDLCAAPGGKAFFAAQKMENIGSITAVDIHAHRVKLITDGAARLGIKIINTVNADASAENPRFFDSFDKVLVDAPCSGYGVIRKKPDIRFKADENERFALAELQRSILAQAAKYVAKDGILVYSTCTLTDEENEFNTEWFEDSFLNFEKLEEKTILPSDYGSDGFYIVKFRRNK